MANAVGYIGQCAENVGNEGEEKSDAVGNEEIFGIIGVHVDRLACCHVCSDQRAR